MACSILLGAVVASSGTALGAKRHAVGRQRPSQPRGSLAIGSLQFPPSLDPTSDPNPSVAEVTDYNVFEHLYQMSPNGRLLPVLALGYSVSADLTSYAFVIRPHVRFSNGHPMTAADVAFGLTRAMAPTAAYPDNGLAGLVSSVTAPSASEVVVNLNSPDPGLLEILATSPAGIVVDPTTLTTNASRPVGTGPFVYSGSVPGRRVDLAANPIYWGHKAHLARVSFDYFTSPDAENSALQAGSVDLIDSEQSPQAISVLGRDPRFVLTRTATDNAVQISINNSDGPLAQLAVRQAIVYAVNRAAVNRTATAGSGVELSSAAGAKDSYFVDLSGMYPYDPAKATALLTEAGYPNGLSTTMVLPEVPYAYLIGPVIIAELGQVGITVQVSMVPLSTWYSRVFKRSKFGLTVIENRIGDGLREYALPSYYWHYADAAEAGALLSVANTETTTTARAAGYRQVLRLITNDAVNDWLYAPAQLLVTARTVTGVGSVGFGNVDSFQLAGLGLNRR